jgi:hypothetical protein
MLIDSSSFRPSTFVCRAALVALFTCASTFGLQAQQMEAAPKAGAAVSATSPKLDLTSLNLASLDLADADGVSYSSSAAPLATSESATLDFKGLPEGMQPPPRRRYGRPRYNDSNHNPDGSSKYSFIAGVGLGGIPVGNLHKYDTASYGLQVGGGRNFNKHLGILAQFDYDHFGLQGSTINNQSLLYFGATGQGLDGNSHIWSFTVDPTFNFYSSEGLGAYAVVGVGFYHKVTNFTLPQTECADYYCYYQYLVNTNVDHYTSNAPGFNGGLGLTFKPSRFASERFYVEARYVFIDNSQRVGISENNSVAAQQAYTGNNYYPANSNRSEYIPIKVGIRF